MSTARMTERAVLASVSATLRAVVIPALDHPEESVDEHVRASVVQLVGLVEHVSARPTNPSQRRRGELVETLRQLESNPIVNALGPGDPAAIASAALVGAVGRDDTAADEVRATLRPVLVAQLDDELAETSALIDAFRGRLRDA